MHEFGAAVAMELYIDAAASIEVQFYFGHLYIWGRQECCPVVCPLYQQCDLCVVSLHELVLTEELFKHIMAGSPVFLFMSGVCLGLVMNLLTEKPRER